VKLLCVIDHFGSGGAQRQLVELACGMAARGHAVQAFVYFPQFNFFRAKLDAHAVAVHGVHKGRGFSPRVLWALARLMRRECFDAVVSFLDRPNTYTELAHLLAGSSTTLVVSERSSQLHDRRRVLAWTKRLLHVRAHAVVANNHTHAMWLRRHHWLSQKVHCIYNGVDLDAFNPSPNVPPTPEALRLLAVGRVGPEKNVLCLIDALAEHHRRHGWLPQLSWAGRCDDSAEGLAYGRSVDAALQQHPAVAAAWQWLGERSDVPALLASHHALVHASFYEGLPNVVCEAMAAGRPVLLSAVCDHPRLVPPGERGFLFDPHDSLSLLAAIESLDAQSLGAWTGMARATRSYAERELGTSTMVAHYEALIAQLRRGDSAAARTADGR